MAAIQRMRPSGSGTRNSRAGTRRRSRIACAMLLAECRAVVGVDPLQQRARVFSGSSGAKPNSSRHFVAGLDHVARDVAGEDAEVRRLGGQRRFLLAFAQLDDQLLGAQQVGAQRVGHDGDDAEAEQAERVRRLHAAPEHAATAWPPPDSMKQGEAAADDDGRGRARPRRHAVTRGVGEEDDQQQHAELADRHPGIGHADRDSRPRSPRNATLAQRLDLEKVQVLADA